MTAVIPSLTARPAWKALETHYQKLRDLHLRRLFYRGTRRMTLTYPVLNRSRRVLWL
jgi:hypothetical protein